MTDCDRGRRTAAAELRCQGWVETPAPRPSLAPFGVLTGDERARRGTEGPPRIRRASPRAGAADAEYVELHARSAFSFLRGSSLPEDLAHAAAAAGHGVFGLADVGGLYGIPRFHTIARRQGVRPLVGAEIDVEGGGRVALLCEDRGGGQKLFPPPPPRAPGRGEGRGRRPPPPVPRLPPTP